MASEAEPSLIGRRQHGSTQLTDAAGHSDGVVAIARWQGCTKQLEKPSSPRSRNRRKKGICITGKTGKSGDRREGDGWVRSSEEAGQCPWSEGALLFVAASTIREARVR